MTLHERQIQVSLKAEELRIKKLKISMKKAWWNIIDRCYNPGNESWRLYGGRGIRVCDRWRFSFENFESDVGQKISLEYSIDRFPDNDGDYKPGNVRWATAKEQGENTRKLVRELRENDEVWVIGKRVNGEFIAYDPPYRD